MKLKLLKLYSIILGNLFKYATRKFLMNFDSIVYFCFLPFATGNIWFSEIMQGLPDFPVKEETSRVAFTDFFICTDSCSFFDNFSQFLLFIFNKFMVFRNIYFVSKCLLVLTVSKMSRLITPVF